MSHFNQQPGLTLSCHIIYLLIDQVYCRFVLLIVGFLIFHFSTIIALESDPPGLAYRLAMSASEIASPRPDRCWVLPKLLSR